VKYQSSETTLGDWLLFAAMLCIGAAGVIALGWLVGWLIFRVVKGG
jgi:hypothetical protein